MEEAKPAEAAPAGEGKVPSEVEIEEVVPMETNPSPEGDVPMQT